MKFKSNQIQPSPHPFLDESNISRLENQLSETNIRQNKTQTNWAEKDILQSLGAIYKINEIKINNEEFLHTIFIQTSNCQEKHKYFYLTHGFGGSSLMYFPITKYLLQHGNVIFWEIRGMGFSQKLAKYHVSLEQSQKFFIQPIDIMLRYYNHENIFFISHSFGGYLTLLYTLKYKSFTSKIKQVILLSPVGITPKQQDYKYKVKSCSDLIHSLGNLISWKFHLTYKSPFRCLCACLKNKVFKGAVDDCQFSEEEKLLMKNLLIGMVEITDGSENVFFNYFQPRVLPKFPIQPIFINASSVNIQIIYGGQQDWVDKKGAQKIRDRFPTKINLKQVQQCGHNFPFFPLQLKKVLQQILFHHKSTKQQSLLKQVKSDYLVIKNFNHPKQQQQKTPRFDQINKNNSDQLMLSNNSNNQNSQQNKKPNLKKLL